MASRGQKRAAAYVLLHIPFELLVPGADAVEIIALGVVHVPDEPLVDDRFHGLRHGDETYLEADGSPDIVFLDRLEHGRGVVEGERDRFFNDEMLPRFGGHDRLPWMIGVRRADVDDVYIAVPEKGVVIVVYPDVDAILSPYSRRIEFPPGHDRDRFERWKLIERR